MTQKSQPKIEAGMTLVWILPDLTIKDSRYIVDRVNDVGIFITEVTSGSSGDKTYVTHTDRTHLRPLITKGQEARWIQPGECAHFYRNSGTLGWDTWADISSVDGDAVHFHDDKSLPLTSVHWHAIWEGPREGMRVVDEEGTPFVYLVDNYDPEVEIEQMGLRIDAEPCRERQREYLTHVCLDMAEVPPKHPLVELGACLRHDDIVYRVVSIDPTNGTFSAESLRSNKNYGLIDWALSPKWSPDETPKVSKYDLEIRIG